MPKIKILEALAKVKDSEIVLLDRRGLKMTSEKFAGWLDLVGRDVFFVIGGTLGFSDEVLAKPFRKIALSDMTFTHEMARLILVEQIYRAVTINRNINYHY